jgi:hypothetical protein
MSNGGRTPDSNPDQEPGHYGAGYGEQVPEEATPQLGPTTDGDQPPGASTDGATDEGATTRGASAEGASTEGATSDGATTDRVAGAAAGEAPPTSEGDDGSAVVFTPADVHARPPDHTPTEAAPASEKAGLIFERS